ncbi:MAG TPA: Nif3-like dinuclear metal center hexameric protein [Clostridia bacterium]|nr:Nif3-like dinuclear metal center hexameric protein [Clostridia bacterium]
MKKINVNDVKGVLDSYAPPELAMEYDNIGLIIGSRTRKVTGILVCLDATLEVLKEAKAKSCNLVVSHHPPIFKGITSINIETEKGGIIEFAIENKISILSYHTNLDVVEGGINSYLAEIFGAENSECVNSGVLFTLKNSMPLRDFAKYIATILNDQSVKVCGKLDKQIKTAFVISGAGGRDEEAYNFAKDNADVFMSAEMKHNLMISAVADDFAVIEFSHYHSEIVCIEVLSKAIKTAFEDINIIKSEQKCPFRTMEEL